MARPLVLAVCLALGVVLGPGLGSGREAAADGKTSRVTIETDPPGAKVYFNVKEDGEVCTTPCTIDAPIGETPIIVEAENRRSIIENLVVPRKTARPIKVSYVLRPALGTLVIEGGDGATITIDDQDRGTAPRRFEEILAGAHHVVLQKNGKKLYDQFVEVEIGREASVPVPALAADPTPAQGPGDAAEIAAAREAPAGDAQPSPALALRAVTDIGFRQFTFQHPKNTQQYTLQNDDEEGEVLTGASIEVWPTTLLRLGVLPGLSISAQFQIGLNPQDVTKQVQTNGMTTTMPTSLRTSWRTFEVGAHQRWTIADTAAVEIGAGYGSERYQFVVFDPSLGALDQDYVPDAAYRTVRIGGRGSLLLGRLEPYAAIESRIVVSAGALEHRHSLGGSANGGHVALGAAVRLGRFEARAEGNLTWYSWTFRPEAGDPDQADGGSDLIERIGVTLGYVY